MNWPPQFLPDQTCATRTGRDTLARWLQGPSPAGDILARQEAVRDLRDRLIGVPYYRLIHAEADGLTARSLVDRLIETIRPA